MVLQRSLGALGGYLQSAFSVCLFGREFGPLFCGHTILVCLYIH